MASKTAQLVKRIHEQTLAGNIGWEETERDDVFQADFPDYSIRYSTHGADYILSIYNQRGSVVETIADTGLNEEEAGFSPFSTMRETYQQARRQALGVERAVDDLLRYLEDA